MSPRSWKEAGRCGQLRDAFDSGGDAEKAATACCDGNGERAPETTRHRSADGRLIGVLGIGHDITEKKQGEEKQGEASHWAGI